MELGWILGGYSWLNSLKEFLNDSPAIINYQMVFLW